MSDKALFQGSDEQEAVYAPQQLPDGTAAHEAAERDDGADDRNVVDDDVGVPAAGAGVLGLTGGGISTGVVGGSPAAIGTAVGEDSPEDETSADHSV